MKTFTLARFDQAETNAGTGFGALKSSAGNLPLKQLAYRTKIVGLARRTTIIQTFYNPFDECIEATYIFPIEGEQAVIDCEMWIADRVVRAKLKERGQARADYRRAIARGYRAALLEENRPETFSMKVGNIAPGEAVQVRIQTVGHLPVVRGEWTLRLPLVVAPRYTSGFPLPGNSTGQGTALDTNEVPDASHVTPPTWLPGFASPVDLQLEVDVELGGLVNQLDWPQHLRSSLHAVLVESWETPAGTIPKSCRVQVHPGERVDRDFILRGDFDDSQTATSLLVDPPVERATDKAAVDENESVPASDAMKSLGTFSLQIVPPRRDTELPRDVVLLLDRSGSMGGWKMEAARRGISRLIDTLTPHDRFQVLAFDTRIESPSDGRLPNEAAWTMADDANRYRAVRWLANIDSRGGTEMGLAIERGLQAFMKQEDGEQTARPLNVTSSRAMVLVTDGQITGEDSLLRLLGAIPQDQRPRMFCLGVDRAVNGSVLQRLTKFTGGTYEVVESEKRLDEVMHRFADEMGSPAITELEIQPDDPSDFDLQLAPSHQRVLYSGRATSIYGRTPTDRPLTLTLRGRLASGSTWEQRLTAEPSPTEARSMSVLLPMWGRARVRELEDTFIAGANRDPALQQEIIQCSLSCNVLSRLTAFVAVDESERVNPDGRLHEITQPVELPEGWQHPALPKLPRTDLIPIPGRVSATDDEQADSMLQEFTDTAIDFTETTDTFTRSTTPSRSSCFLDDFSCSISHFDMSVACDEDSDLPDGEVYYSPEPPLAPPPARHPAKKTRSRAQPELAPVVRLVQLILTDAVKLRASHVILRPVGGAMRVAFIIDGKAVERDAVPRDLQSAVVEQLRILAKVDITVRDRLQSGSGHIVVASRLIKIEAHFAPCEEGTAVMIDFTEQEERDKASLPEPVLQWWRLCTASGC